MSQSKKGPPKKKSLVKFLLWVYLGIFLALLLAWEFNLGGHLLNLYKTAKDLQSDASIITGNKLSPIVIEAASDIDAIYNEVSPLFPILNALQGLPWVGSYFGQVDPILTYADGLAQAGNEIVIGLEPLLGEPQPDQVGVTLPERASQVLQAGQAHFANAAMAITQADQVRSRIRPDLLPESIRSQFIELDGRFSLLKAGVNLLQSAPQLLGVAEPQNYLLLAQNRDELRPTGGFISGIGLITIQDGKILGFNLGDSYQIDDFSKPYPSPPEALKQLMLADYWVTRDSNWSPDFPTSAQAAQDLYTLSTGIQTHGVIAFNQLSIQSVLAVTGPVEVPGTEVPITADNVEGYMRQVWAPAPEQGLSDEWWLHRKDFMQNLGNAILTAILESSDQAKFMNIAKTTLDMLEKGQLLVYFNEPQAQAALGIAAWDGGVDPGGGDFLYLVDSNVGFNKVDSVVQRSLAYIVDLSDLNNPTGSVTVTYKHNGNAQRKCSQEISYGNGTYADLQQRCYLDYWRVYSPEGSALLSRKTEPVPAEQLLNKAGWSGQVESQPGEANTQVFAGLLMLPIGNSSQFSISYSLPGSVIRVEPDKSLLYTLRVQVQSGLIRLPVQLEIKLPGSAGATNPVEGWTQIDANTWSWQGDLDKRIDFQFHFLPNP